MAKEWEIITKTNFWGNKTYEFREKKDDGCGWLILLGLIFAVIVVLFTGPYFLIDRNFKPFEFNWLKNYNIWIFCISTWIFVLTLIVMIKSFIRFRSFTENAFEQTYETPYLTFGLFLTSMSFFASFLFETKISEYANYLYALYTLLIGWLLYYLIKKLNSDKRYPLIIYFIVLLFLPFAWVNSNNFNIFSNSREIEEVKFNGSINAVSGANMRQLPTKSSNIITKLENHTKIDLISDSSYNNQIKWYKIKAGEHEGWVSSKLILKNNE
jgi:hypothetical protein